MASYDTSTTENVTNHKSTANSQVVAATSETQTLDEPENLSDPEYRARHKHEFGRRLMTTVIDDRARRNHPMPYVSIPNSTDPSDGYRDISYREFAKAIDKCAGWIKGQIYTSDRFEPLIYLGAFDLRYQLLAMAAVKTGHVMFFISPRNSLEAQLSLIDEGQATKIIVSAGSTIEAMVNPILEKRTLQKFTVPELEYFLDDEYVDHVPFTGTFDEYRLKPWILLHTSGTTGNPKIVTIRHGYPTINDAYWHSPHENELFQRIGQQRLFVPYPPFHMGGIIGTTSMVIFVDATLVMPPLAPLTAELVNSVHLNGRIDVTLLPPALIVELAKNDEYLENLKRLNGVSYGGGPLPQETGDKISDFVGVYTSYGSTEILNIPMLSKPREHWCWLKFDLDYSGAQFWKVEDTDLYECVMVRDPKLELVQAVFVTFPELQEYHSRDLFARHPTEHDLWRYEGRLDDVIVLNNAEKINPVDMEGTIVSSPEVTGALVVGQGRFQTALLVEAKTQPETEQDEQRLIESIWPYVQKANERCGTYGRVDRELIGFTSPDKPFARAGKGTVQRQRSVILYKSEIDLLYSNYEAQKASTTAVPKNFENPEETETFLRSWFSQQGRLDGLDQNEDFFSAGMDSLQVNTLVRQINSASAGQKIGAKQVYNNPTIRMLAASLSKAPISRKEDEDDVESWKLMESMFQRYKS